jgi:hypothetical protein
MESTFAGIDQGPLQGQHISIKLLESMGADLCRGLLIEQNLAIPSGMQYI